MARLAFTEYCYNIAGYIAKFAAAMNGVDVIAFAGGVGERGIDESRIIKEDKSINTKQNFDYSMELVDLKDKKVGIVTNNFHAYRASKIAEKCGLKNVSVIAAGSVKTYLPNNMFREVLAVVKDFIVGNI